MADSVVLSVGTKRGLFILRSDRKRSTWKLSDLQLRGWNVYHAIVDTRGGGARVHAAATNFSVGTTTLSADLKALKFEGAKAPPVPPKMPAKALKFASKYGIPTAPQVWHIEPARASEKNVFYAGTAPAGLFRSEDGGRNWAPVTSINDHPTRKDWNPGAGGMCLHSIQCDPKNPKRMWVGISAAGVFRTDDGMKTWKPINTSVASYVGAPKGDVGSCVHKLLLHPAANGRMYNRNHMGVYYSDDHGDTWKAIHKDLPTDFGFGMALDPRDPDACFVTPLVPEGGFYRATDGALKVWRGGPKGWKALEKGLPQDDAYLGVLREGMSNDTLDPCGVYVGTSTGHIYASADAGRSWSEIARTLPPINSVSAAVV